MARMGEKRNEYRILVRKLEGRKNNLEERGVDGKIILKWTSRKYGNAWIEFIWLSPGTDRGAVT